MPKVPYPYKVNGKLVTVNGSIIPICSLSNRSLLPSLTVLANAKQNTDETNTQIHFVSQSISILFKVLVICNFGLRLERQVRGYVGDPARYFKLTIV